MMEYYIYNRRAAILSEMIPKIQNKTEFSSPQRKVRTLELRQIEIYQSSKSDTCHGVYQELICVTLAKETTRMPKNLAGRRWKERAEQQIRGINPQQHLPSLPMKAFYYY